MKILALALWFAGPVFSSDLFLSPALTDNALAASHNPAGLSTFRRGNLVFLTEAHADSFYAAGASVGGVGLGAIRSGGTSEYFLSNGFRLPGGVSMGLRSGFSDAPGDNAFKYDFGMLMRPSAFVSLGAHTDNFISGSNRARRRFLVGGALKPVDGLVLHVNADNAGKWSTPRVGAEWLLGGINLVAQTDAKFQGVSVGVSLSATQWEAGALFPLKKNPQRRFALSFSGDRKPGVFPSPKRVAVIRIGGVILDDDPEFSLFGPSNAQSLGFVLSQLRNAARDGDIGMVLLKIENLGCGLGMVEEMRGAIQDIRMSGKKVICFLENVELLEYYLACAASEIIVQPMGAWMVAGVSSEITFYKGLFDKLGIKAEFIRAGEYKAAPEPLISDTMSKEFRENEESLLKSIFDHLLKQISVERDIDSAFVAETVDKGNIRLKEAVDKRFIDGVGYFNDLIAKYAGKRERAVDLSGRTQYGTKWKPKNRIAVVLASGVIVSGESFTDFFSGTAFMGAETVARILKHVRKDKSIKAVVLRINSGGGSGVASDVIWHEVQKLKEEGKPVVVSIGDVAASGGYYIACAADTIVCNPGAIIGSIGVFTGKFVVKGLYDKLGLKKETVKFGRNANAFTDYAEFTDEQRKAIEGSIKEFYDGFVDRVAGGRKLTRERADSLGRGQVFTGIQGLANGLVDVEGGIGEAIDIAKLKAGFSEDDTPDIEVFPKRKGFFASLAEGSEAKSAIPVSRLLNALNRDPVLAIMPFSVDFK